MVKAGIESFRDKRVLFLQGPVGPFFARLACDLQAVGAQIFKVNFNGGDWLFFRSGINFRWSADEWPEFIERLLLENRIDVVLLFGDCRPLHKTACRIAHQLGIEIAVFEEGYVRPDFVTLEAFGVNGYSRISRDPEFYRQMPALSPRQDLQVGHTFWYLFLWVVLYYLACSLARPVFRDYRHHRRLGIVEAWPQLHSAVRKWKYTWKESAVATRLFTKLSHRYFLVPLQVHNDSQIHVHSEYASVRRFILEVIRSFASHAPADVFLVIKHHPLDRAYNDYSAVIRRAAERRGIGERVMYIHDQHLPSVLQHACGVVVVNSTVGFSALYHGKPVKVCGTAMYDMPGLTYQKSLAEFWSDASGFVMDKELYQQYRSYLIETTQLNGSFFKRLPGSATQSGLRWS